MTAAATGKIGEYCAQFGDKLPKVLADEIDALEMRLK